MSLSLQKLSRMLKLNTQNCSLWIYFPKAWCTWKKLPVCLKYEKNAHKRNFFLPHNVDRVQLLGSVGPIIRVGQFACWRYRLNIIQISLHFDYNLLAFSVSIDAQKKTRQLLETHAILGIQTQIHNRSVRIISMFWNATFPYHMPSYLSKKDGVLSNSNRYH